MLFLDNLSPITMENFFSSTEYSFATGARVFVHAPDTLADMNRGVAVSPGVETTLVVNQIRRKRLTEPWDNCTVKQYLYETTEQDRERRIRYTTDSCWSLCVQNLV